ncbi:carboxypeptidase Taq [Geomicrobium halophilum]|uniref:Metal-dependent carboxypeptidase n=1 Tax=Geomicrobium halophilum TaxID=549000 RepID=A0A841Q017_9BACL|nr:carboxypeptidase M32 [Geomicrobium halophilum]MBB6450803.1 carboxypeptidase Taq [Geomicrobium halophilum]
MDVEKSEQQFKDILKKRNHYQQISRLLSWDTQTGAPKKGAEQRAEVNGSISAELFRLSISEEMKKSLDELKKADLQSEVLKKSVEECAKEYNKNNKIPEDEYKDYVILKSNAATVWEEAKENDDFSLLEPYLEKLVEYNKCFIEYLGYEDHPYDPLLDNFEPGVFVKTIDRLFAQLKERLIPLVEAVRKSPHQPQTDFLFQSFSKENQRALSKCFLEKIGYDFESGRLDESLHPFTMALHSEDVRVTTHFKEEDVLSGLLSTIHEGGHALYEQNIATELKDTPMAEGTSFGIHESQSLLWEKFIGQNKNFWKAMYPLLIEHSDGQFTDVSFDDYFFALNEAKPSFIRVDADELTYCLHIIVRYELEKGIFEGNIEVHELPKLWNDKMEEYLGIRPSTDREGVLQDAHWAGGEFGYFPSYALGYIYAAQLKEVLVKDVPMYDEKLLHGDFTPIKAWLTKNVHQHGKLKTPAEIIQETTGGSIDAEPLLNYLETKYSDLYQLKNH